MTISQPSTMDFGCGQTSLNSFEDETKTKKVVFKPLSTKFKAKEEKKKKIRREKEKKRTQEELALQAEREKKQKEIEAMIEKGKADKAEKEAEEQQRRGSKGRQKNINLKFWPKFLSLRHLQT